MSDGKGNTASADSVKEEGTSPSVTIQDPCTSSNFCQHAHDLSDRQLLCWSLNTETKVRFAKFQGREDVNVSTTLNTKYLLDLYPAIDAFGTKSKVGVLAHDAEAFLRKSLPMIRARHVDHSFANLQHLEMRGHEKSSNALPTTPTAVDTDAIPPNLLFFEIILEAFMGYRIPFYNSPDATMPRAAVMGGAVVAALTSWRDKNVVNLFRGFKPTDTKIDEYLEEKRLLLKQLNDYFLCGVGLDVAADKKETSVFDKGDVDVFLQPSPLTRALIQKLSRVLPADILERISSFLGGCGYVQEDLNRFGKKLTEEHLVYKLEDEMQEEELFEINRQSKKLKTEHPADKLGATEEQEEDAEDSGRLKTDRNFCYALAKNGLSFTLGLDNDREWSNEVEVWPRTTQLIMLNEKADLVGALLDFDISLASCAYDGVGVRVTPRAAFSLMAMTQIVTPFVLAEKRNRKRIVKYYKRGFDAVMLDPCCLHQTQCVANGINTVLKKYDDSTLWRRGQWATYYERREVLWVQDAPWKSFSLRSQEQYRRINEQQALEDNNRYFCCHIVHPVEYRLAYTIALFEKSEGHAVEYFSKRFQWSTVQRQEVDMVLPHLRFACKACRREYAVQLVLEKAPCMAPETVDELLHGELSYRNSTSVCGDLDPSFYCIGAFNSTLVANSARSAVAMNSTLHAQKIHEQARYILRHGNLDGYKTRFVHGLDLDNVFKQAEQLNFPVGNRAPVGLNPERFIASCESCNDWLHDCEFGTQFCERCLEMKPAANE